MFTDFDYLSVVFATSYDLSNGERVQLAVKLLEGCSKTPRTKLGELFDKCLAGLKLIARVCKSCENPKPKSRFDKRPCSRNK